jgi:hypothetical protein
MASHALYFPYIRIPEDAWFTRVLLYWDSVGTIVPGGLEDDPRYISPRMAELRAEGLLAMVAPAYDLTTIPRFRDEFARLLEADEDIARRRGAPAGASFAKVHVFKLGDVAEYLIDEGLARHCDGPGWELWIEVEERTAGMFMAYLAATLGGLDRVCMDPVTDQTGAMAALVGADSRTGLTLKRARELRLGVLEALLPGPATPVDAKALRKFKDEHGDELAAFRDRVDEELLKAAGLEEADAQAEQARISAAKLKRERDEIVSLMEKRRWPDIVFGSIASVGVAAAGVAGALVLGGGAAAAAVAAPGLIPAVYAALKDARTRPDLGMRPLAYAALAQREFGP